MPDAKNTDPRQTFANPGISTVFADRFYATKRSDGTVLLRCMSLLPEGDFEQARIALTVDHAKRLVDMLARLIEHYPQKPAS